MLSLVKRVFMPLPHRLAADDSLYGVRIRGDQNNDGSWQPCIEFESRRGIKLETCPKLTVTTVDELKHWAERLDEPALLSALTEASKGPIRRVRRRRDDV